MQSYSRRRCTLQDIDTLSTDGQTFILVLLASLYKPAQPFSSSHPIKLEPLSLVPSRHADHDFQVAHNFGHRSCPHPRVCPCHNEPEDTLRSEGRRSTGRRRPG